MKHLGRCLQLCLALVALIPVLPATEPQPARAEMAQQQLHRRDRRPTVLLSTPWVAPVAVESPEPRAPVDAPRAPAVPLFLRLRSLLR